MIKISMNKFIFILMLLAAWDESLLFAETYQWSDADGSIHFSDTPENAPKNKQPIVRQDDSTINPTQSPMRSAPQNPSQNCKESRPKGKAESVKSKPKVDPEIDAHLKQIWKTLRDAIISGDIETALIQLVPGIQDRYRAMMNDPSSGIVDRFKEINRLEVFTVTEKTAQAGAIRIESEGTFAYPVNFVKNFGSWKIYGF